MIKQSNNNVSSINDHKNMSSNVSDSISRAFHGLGNYFSEKHPTRFSVHFFREESLEKIHCNLELEIENQSFFSEGSANHLETAFDQTYRRMKRYLNEYSEYMA